MGGRGWLLLVLVEGGGGLGWLSDGHWEEEGGGRVRRGGKGRGGRRGGWEGKRWLWYVMAS